MKLSKLVVNSSPIISLSKIGYADLLFDLSSELIIPEAVYQEINNHKCNDSAVKWIKNQDSSLFRPVEVPGIVSDWNLGRGESQVIAYAYHNKEFAAVIDDRAAKKSADYARAFSLFSRYYDYATCEAALENENKEVRQLSIKYLNEMKNSGDPFAIEILGSIKL
ncbi:MAG TPA: hypothetical protein DET40_17595 [Lentisphaeria bacterium]|nr:MAG: hypothetical protein A2X45_02410 [Lentisphaerae bacterium GWF2_50_93]HCE45357.1 hypothetical protein [Lentisphaeria bacterium]